MEKILVESWREVADVNPAAGAVYRTVGDGEDEREDNDAEIHGRFGST